MIRSAVNSLLWTLVCIVVLIPYRSKAQVNLSECEQRFEIAQQLYNAGQLQLVLDTLRFCYERPSNRRKDILSLSAATYKFLDEDQMARQQILKLFSLDPFYTLDQSIPELTYIENDLLIYPRYTFTGKIGVYIFNEPVIIGRNNIEGIEILDEDFGLIDGDPVAFKTELIFGKSLSQKGPYLNAGLGLSRYSFRYTGSFANVTNPEGATDEVNVTFREKHWWVHVPVYLSKYFLVEKGDIRKRTFFPYAYAGISLDFLRKPTAELENPSVAYQGVADGAAMPLEDISIQNLRHGFNYSLLGGAGFKAKSGVHAFFVELGYTHMIRNLVIDDKLNDPSFQDIETHLHYRTNDFQLSNLALSVGYSRFFYRAEEKR